MQIIEYPTGGKGRRSGLFVHHTDADREFAYDRKLSVFSASFSIPALTSALHQVWLLALVTGEKQQEADTYISRSFWRLVTYQIVPSGRNEQDTGKNEHVRSR